MSNIRKVLRAFTVFVVVLGLGLAGVAGLSAAAQAEERLVVALPAPLTSMDPHYGQTRLDMTVLENMFDTLVRRRADGGLDPALADNWYFTEDGMTAVFELRKGVQFHNGEEFTAEAVKFNFDRAMSDRVPFQYKSLYSTVNEVRIVDDYTVEFGLDAPTPALFTNLTNLPILPPHYLTEVGEAEFVRNPVGTGPFAFRSLDRSGILILEAYDEFYLGRPTFDVVEFHPIPDESTQVAALLSGEVDIVGPLTPELAPTIQGSGRADVVDVPSLRRVYLGLRADQPPFDNADVRRAISLAIDRGLIIDGLLAGGAYESNSPILDLEFGYDPELPKNEYDPAKARELLAEAGYPQGFSVAFQTPTGRYPKDSEAAQVISAMLSEIGINAEVEVTEWNRLRQRMDAREHTPIYLIGWGGGGTFDPENTLSTTFVCEGGSPSSRLYYCNPELDELIAKQRVTGDVDERAGIIRDILHLIQEDNVWIPLWNYSLSYAIGKGVQWEPRPDEAYWMFSAEPVR